MWQENISLSIAFAAGFLSFLSPCVLPLVPAYLSYLSGLTLAELTQSKRMVSFNKKILLNSLLFVAGFSLVFILLGASATVVGALLKTRFELLSKIAGTIIILFGLHLLGVFKRLPFMRFMYLQSKIQVNTARVSPWVSFLLGLAFAFGWSPCIGPILGGILALAATQETVGKGILLLSAYSAGLGLPFILIAFGANMFMAALNKMKKGIYLIEILSGSLLVAVGLLIFFNKLQMLSQYLNIFPEVNL